MSDFREAFEAFEALDELVQMAVQHHGQVRAADEYREMIKSALQSQTAPAVPEFLLEMSQQMREQPNRMTAHPFWQVRCHRYLPTLEGYAEHHTEICDDEGVVYRSDAPISEFHQYLIENHEEWCQEWSLENHDGDDWQSDIECYLDLDCDELPDSLRKIPVQEIEEVVSTHLTQAGAEQFIKRKQHDYPKLFTYVESAYWSPQLRELQDWIISLSAPQPDHSPDAGKVVHWAIKNPGNADQRRCESRAVRKALGFAPDADDVSPRDLVDAIAEIKNAPAADGGEVEPVAWAVFADNGNLRIWGREKPKAFPNAAPLYLRPTVKNSLTAEPHQAESLAQLDSEDQKGMERIVEAVAHIGIDFGYGTYELEQCHIDRAREIKESLARLRASQQEGGEG